MPARGLAARVIEAVGFDLDYTLVVPDRDRATLLAEATERVGAPTVSREAYLEAHAANVGTETRAPIFEAVLPDGADTSSAALARAYRETVEEALVPIRGVPALVDRLRVDYRVGILTDGPTRAQHGKLATLGWSDLFDAVVVTGALAAQKPDGRAFDALLRALDAQADRTAYVGDHPEADVRGASEAGLVAIQVVYDGGPARDPAADAVVERDRLAATLPGLLESL